MLKEKMIIIWIIALLTLIPLALAELPQWTEVVIQTDNFTNLSQIDEEGADANTGNFVFFNTGRGGGATRRSRGYMDVKPLVCDQIPSTAIAQN